MLNEMDNMHRMYCTIGCNRTITNDYIGLTLLPNSLLLAGWNDASKQKDNAQRHCQSMHTIQVTQITALLRCGITTQKKKTFSYKKKLAGHLQFYKSCNTIMISGEDCCSKGESYLLFCFGKRKQRYSMLYVFTGVALHNSWRFSYFFIKC